MDIIRSSFMNSIRLQEHMRWLVRTGGMWTRRDEVLIFHACVPVDSDGTPQTLRVEGHDLVSALREAPRHVGAHAAEADHRELHGRDCNRRRPARVRNQERAGEPISRVGLTEMDSTALSAR